MTVFSTRKACLHCLNFVTAIFAFAGVQILDGNSCSNSFMI